MNSSIFISNWSQTKKTKFEQYQIEFRTLNLESNLSLSLYWFNSVTPLIHTHMFHFAFCFISNLQRNFIWRMRLLKHRDVIATSTVNINLSSMSRDFFLFLLPFSGWPEILFWNEWRFYYSWSCIYQKRNDWTQLYNSY